MGDMRAERRVSGDGLFKYHEIITLDGSNPATHVGQSIYYGQPHVAFPSRVLRKVGALVFPLWSQRDLNPSTAAFPIEHRADLFDKEYQTIVNNPKTTKREKAIAIRCKHLTAIDGDKSGLKNDTYVERRTYMSPGREVVAAVAAQLEKIQRHEVDRISLELDLVKARSKKDNETAVKAIQDSIATKVGSIATERATLQDLLTSDVAGKPKSGIMIIRWATDEEKGLSLDAGEIFKGGLEKSQSRSGYLVIGGVRFSSLVLGEDFLRTMGYQLNSGSEIPRLTRMIEKGMVGITKYMISAQHVAYVNDLQTQLNAQFSANISKKMLKDLSSIDQIKIQYALSTIGSFNNTGQLGDAEVTQKPYVFGGPNPELLKDEWMPIYSVIAMPKGTLLDRIRSDFGSELENLPPCIESDQGKQKAPASK